MYIKIIKSYHVITLILGIFSFRTIFFVVFMLLPLQFVHDFLKFLNSLKYKKQISSQISQRQLGSAVVKKKKATKIPVWYFDLGANFSFQPRISQNLKNELLDQNKDYSFKKEKQMAILEQFWSFWIKHWFVTI